LSRAAATLLLLTLPGAGPLLASESMLLLGPTPLALKDGRIARISVHTVPFQPGAEAPGESARATLARMLAEIATDCFLTAQVIGHVEPGAERDGEALAAHRLARARAESVRALLTGAGLPPGSIAAVWDWQFAVQEPRVTLWVFRLNEGDDCDGTPLVASVATAAAAPDRAMAMAPVPDPAVEAPPAPEHVAEPMPAVEPAEASGAPPLGTGVDLGMLALAAPEAEPPPLAVPEPALTGLPPEPQESVESVVATPARPDATPGNPTTEVATPEPLIVHFANNSSFFPKRVAEQLGRLADGLAADVAYEVALEASVSVEALGDGSTAKARDYNVWLAERRVRRVREALERHAGGRALTFRSELVDGDSSRRVVVRIRPLP
jgi:outer membrane protein OmpA-like peptidoglycan-associated protein